MYLLGLAAIGAVIAGCLRRKPRGVRVVWIEKVGQAPKHSRLKKEWTTPQRLEKTLAYFCRRGYTFLRPNQLQTAVPQKSVLLACMGGYQSFYTTVFPLLEKYNIPAVVFIAPDLVGTYNAWQNPHQEPWQDLLTAAQIKQLKKSPLLHWGALPLSEPNQTACSQEQAALSIQESIYRLQTQFKLTVEAWSIYPVQKLSTESIHPLANENPARG